MSQKDKNRQLISQAFQDDRVPSSYQVQKTDSTYKRQDFLDYELDDKPTRDRPTRGIKQDTISAAEKIRKGKENQRNLINIDENEDTFNN